MRTTSRASVEIGNGGKLKLSGITMSAAKERARLVKSLKRKYG